MGDAQEVDEDFRYGQLAIEGRFITPDQFDTAMDRVKQSGKRIWEVLVGEVIHVELPKAGQKLTRGQPCAEIESVKSVNDYYSAVDGEVVEVNAQLAAHPELVNEDPAGAGWFAKVKPTGKDPLAGLLSRDEYQAKTKK